MTFLRVNFFWKEMFFFFINCIFKYKTTKKMEDLVARKNRFIEEVRNIEDEKILKSLEVTLKKKKQELKKPSPAQKTELDSRLENFQKHPNDLLDWEEVSKDW